MSDHDDRRPLGERPGVNGNPVAPVVRDGPARRPRSWRSLVLEVVPVLVLAGVVILLASR